MSLSFPTGDRPCGGGDKGQGWETSQEAAAVIWAKEDAFHTGAAVEMVRSGLTRLPVKGEPAGFPERLAHSGPARPTPRM